VPSPAGAKLSRQNCDCSQLASTLRLCQPPDAVRQDADLESCAVDIEGAASAAYLVRLLAFRDKCTCPVINRDRKSVREGMMASGRHSAKTPGPW
jgi:hypothetical protein